ncbi:MAG: hypothetical protein NTW09_05360 [Candidatus Omnitrophica bacterium]|nr:hypothetical protein [Candidatus Omnitrophota bacterium]
MIEINLLPEELKKKNEPKFKKFNLSGLSSGNFNINKMPLVKIGIIAIAALAAFHLALFLVGTASKDSLASLAKKRDACLPKKNEADSLRNELVLINKKVTAIDGLMVKRLSWAKKLDGLSDALTPGIWLTDLSYDERTGDRLVPVARTPNGKSKKDSSRSVAEKVVYRYLVLSGYASSMGEQGTALIGKFIKSLKESSQFYSDFSDITLDSIKSDKFQDQEVMNFKITCMFKEEK